MTLYNIVKKCLIDNILSVEDTFLTLYSRRFSAARQSLGSGAGAEVEARLASARAASSAAEARVRGVFPLPYVGSRRAARDVPAQAMRAGARRRAARQARGVSKTNFALALLNLLFGGVAGLFAQSVTYPLDIVRRRIQVVGAAGGYVSPWRALVDIGKTEGLRNGLYKGVTMNWLKGPVSVAVSFFVNDSVKAYFRERRERW